MVHKGNPCLWEVGVAPDMAVHMEHTQTPIANKKAVLIKTHDLQCRISENVTDKSSSKYYCIFTLIQLEKQKYHIGIEEFTWILLSIISN